MSSSNNGYDSMANAARNTANTAKNAYQLGKTAKRAAAVIKAGSIGAGETAAGVALVGWPITLLLIGIAIITAIILAVEVIIMCAVQNEAGGIFFSGASTGGFVSTGNTQAAQYTETGRAAYEGDSSAQEQIINVLGPVAQTAGRPYGFCPSVLVAQTILETGWLSYHSSHPDTSINPSTNNCMGMNQILDQYRGEWDTPWDGKYQSFVVPQWVNGSIVLGSETMRVYPNMETCMADFACWRITRHPELKGADYKTTVAGALKGYATDPSYQDTVIRLIESHNLQRFDSGASVQAGAISSGTTSMNTTPSFASGGATYTTVDSNPVTATGTGGAIIYEASKYVGCPYVWGGWSLTNGCDCSHFVYLILKQLGLYSGEYMQSTYWADAGTRVPPGQEQAGDVVVWDGHVGFYDGQGYLIEAKGSAWGITHDRTVERADQGSHGPHIAVVRFTGDTSVTLGAGGRGGRTKVTGPMGHFLDGVSSALKFFLGNSNYSQLSAKFNNIGSNNYETMGGGTLVSLGQWRLTGYCNCSECCGKWAGGPTASGVMPTAGKTVAIHASAMEAFGLKFGDQLSINGHIYTLEDHGGSEMSSSNGGKCVDIYVANHSECYSDFCNGYAEVFKVVEGGGITLLNAGGMDSNGIMNVPYINQGLGYYVDGHWEHSEWASAVFNDNGHTLQQDGCAQCSVVMALSYCTGRLIPPTEIMNIPNSKHNAEGGGSFSDIGITIAQRYNVPAQTTNSMSVAIEALKKGHPVMAFVNSNTRFTSGLHYILLIGYTNDGKIAVNDPGKTYNTYYINGGEAYAPSEIEKGLASSTMAFTIFG